MAHPSTRAARRLARRQIIARRIKNGGAWTSCACGDTPWWLLYSAVAFDMRLRPGIRGEHARSGLCWNCFAHTGNPRWTGKLDKWHVHPNPNREDDWHLRGVLRRDYRAGGGRRGGDWGAKPGPAGRFRLHHAEREWGGLGDDSVD